MAAPFIVEDPYDSVHRGLSSWTFNVPRHIEYRLHRAWLRESFPLNKRRQRPRDIDVVLTLVHVLQQILVGNRREGGNLHCMNLLHVPREWQRKRANAKWITIEFDYVYVYLMFIFFGDKEELWLKKNIVLSQRLHMFPTTRFTMTISFSLTTRFILFIWFAVFLECCQMLSLQLNLTMFMYIWCSDFLEIKNKSYD